MVHSPGGDDCVLGGGFGGAGWQQGELHSLSERQKPTTSQGLLAKNFFGGSWEEGKGAWMSLWKLGSMDSISSGLFSPTI